MFHNAIVYLRTQGDRYDRVFETVSTRPFAAHHVVGRKAVALYHQTAEEVWNLEFPPPVAYLGRYVLEPRWIHQMRHSRIVAASPSTATALARFGIVCEDVVPPGCDAPVGFSVRDGPANPPHLLWIGRLVRTKRPLDALAAFSELRNRIPGISLDLVGSGYLEQSVRSIASLGARVHGDAPEGLKHQLLARADLMLLPGTREGWGIVAMEAASYGVPVVAYDVPGLRDAVVDGVTGFLTAPNPHALAMHAERTLTHPTIWRRISAAARSRSAAFTWQDSTDALARVLDKPLDSLAVPTPL